jgi:CBS domain-containing protein/sporulation protein YlmC with PRC-barrel domain
VKGVAGPIYVSRLVRLPLLDADGMALGRIDDVVVVPSGSTVPPRVLGFVALVQRRGIFVNGNRVEEIDASGVRLRGGTVDLRRFALRAGELLLKANVLDRPTPGGVVNDVAIEEAEKALRRWVVGAVVLGRGGLLRRREGATVSWREVAALFDTGPMASQLAALNELHPAELATRIVAMPLERRRALAEAMDDERLADLLEEMPEDEQIRLIESLDLDRAADVLEEMEADDAADLLAELPAYEREELLDHMEPDDASDLRRLLAYAGNTAGGLMTPDPIILTGDTTVAEALARIRDGNVPAAISAQVFVVEPPTAVPTGRFLGTVGFQRLLREPPMTAIGACLDQRAEPVGPNLRELEVARRLAAYDAIAVPVCDDAGRMVGAVTVDDVLDRVLPEGWRETPT